MSALDMPPALFDLDEPATAAEPVVVQRRQGHQLAVHYRQAGGADIRCTCGEGGGGPRFDVARWAYRHLGIEYDTAIDQAAHRRSAQ